MQLTKIVDPRDNLGRASRDELWDFAKANGVAFDQRTATKQYMERELRSRGLTNIRPAVRFMGYPTGEVFPPDGSPVTVEPAKVTEVDADADMVRQMKEQARQEWPVESSWSSKTELPGTKFEILKPVAEMNQKELRAECKRRGIKMRRTDNLSTLRDKLKVQEAVALREKLSVQDAP